MKNHHKILERLQKENPACFRCGSSFGLQIHHAIYTDEKKFKKIMDLPENLVLMCADCNVNKKGNIENFYFRNLVFNYKLRLGYDVEAWHGGIRKRVRDNFYVMSDEEYLKETKKRLSPVSLVFNKTVR